MMDEQEFITRGTDATHALMKVLSEHTKGQTPEMAFKISLLALSKASASMIVTMQDHFESDDGTNLLDMFVSTVIASVDIITDSENSSKRIIDKMMGKPCD